MSLTPDFSAASTPADEPNSIMRVEGRHKVWRNNRGKLHRIDGPAIEYSSGSKSWWVNDQRHRIDGPAIELADGYKSWWINGKELTEYEFNIHLEKLAAEKKALADAAHKKTLIRIDHLAAHITRNRRAQP